MRFFLEVGVTFLHASREMTLSNEYGSVPVRALLLNDKSSFDAYQIRFVVVVNFV